MTVARSLHYCRVWLQNLVSLQALSAVLNSFGALWLIVEITAFFSGGTVWPDKVRELWAIFGLGGFAVAAYQCRPRLSFKHKLTGRDAAIEIAVGNLFDSKGAVIVGTNTSFDTRISNELISEKSVQGAFTRKFYSDETQLDRELSNGLAGLSGQTLPGTRVGKSIKYKMGTCVRLNTKQRTAYLLAIADINEHGTASGSFSDLQEALARLWVFVGTRGLKEPLVMPVLGTGFSRLRQTREEVIHEIIRSFIAACSERTFTDHLTIVITPQDMIKHRISLEKLSLFLQHECEYSSFVFENHQPIGTSA